MHTQAAIIKMLTDCLHMDVFLGIFHGLASKRRMFSGTMGLWVIVVAVGGIVA